MVMTVRSFLGKARRRPGPRRRPKWDLALARGPDKLAVFQKCLAGCATYDTSAPPGLILQEVVTGAVRAADVAFTARRAPPCRPRKEWVTPGTLQLVSEGRALKGKLRRVDAPRRRSPGRLRSPRWTRFHPQALARSSASFLLVPARVSSPLSRVCADE